MCGSIVDIQSAATEIRRGKKEEETNHQSPTAPSLATHPADAVAAHECHIYVTLTSYLRHMHNK